MSLGRVGRAARSDGVDAVRSAQRHGGEHDDGESEGLDGGGGGAGAEVLVEDDGPDEDTELLCLRQQARVIEESLYSEPITGHDDAFAIAD